MNQELLNRLRAVTEEEQKILDGRASVEKELYTSGKSSRWTARKCWNPAR